jgi:hypothetical protein
MTVLASSIVKVSLFVFALKNRVSGSFLTNGMSGMTGASTIGFDEDISYNCFLSIWQFRTNGHYHYHFDNDYQETMSDCHQNLHRIL